MDGRVDGRRTSEVGGRKTVGSGRWAVVRGLKAWGRGRRGWQLSVFDMYTESVLPSGQTASRKIGLPLYYHLLSNEVQQWIMNQGVKKYQEYQYEGEKETNSASARKKIQYVVKNVVEFFEITEEETPDSITL